ncbi:LysM peptidoglycan-binding domain-containing protein [Bacillus spizizenii]|nr:LysM peptidoglycan-binding domain-containing protein [Bacillus spizizenii]
MSKRINISLNTLQSWNGIKSTNKIYVGERTHVK